MTGPTLRTIVNLCRWMLPNFQRHPIRIPEPKYFREGPPYLTGPPGWRKKPGASPFWFLWETYPCPISRVFSAWTFKRARRFLSKGPEGRRPTW